MVVADLCMTVAGWLRWIQVKDIMQEAQQGKLEPQPGQTMFSAFEFNVNTVSASLYIAVSSNAAS